MHSWADGSPADAAEPWSLPGYDVRELIGYGATGEVWRAVELATGDVVALKRLRPGAGADAVDALRREAAVLRTLDTPHVVRLRDVVGSGDGSGAVLVLDHAAGGSLAALLARRGALDPGEVITLAAPLAQALAAAHARGLVHGDVSPSNVLFTADGMPLLADLGVARLVGDWAEQGTAEYLDPAVAGGAPLSPASDVWALAAVCHHALAGSPPHEGAAVDDVLAAAADGGRAPLGLLAPGAPRLLVEAVEAALQRDPGDRPDAASFGAALRRSHGVAPVRLRGQAAAAPGVPVRETHAVPRQTPAPVVGKHARPGRRRLLVAVCTVLVLVAAAAVGWGLGLGTGGDSAAVLPAAADDGSAPAAHLPWPEVLDQLDAARADAFGHADVGGLAAVDAPGSPQLASDTGLVQQLVVAGQTASGVRHAVRSVGERSVAADVAELRVTDTLSAYEVHGRDGGVVQQVPARGPRAFDVRLARTEQGWRLASVTPVG